MIPIPQNIDSTLFTELSGDKVAEYLYLKTVTADSSLDSLALAWLYRDLASDVIWFAVCAFAIAFGLAFGWFVFKVTDYELNRKIKNEAVR